MLEGHGAFFSRGEGLAFQTQFEHLLREDFANLDDEVFEFSQLGTPLGTPGSPDAVRKVFGDAFDVSARFFYLGTPLLVACHPWLPVDVKAKIKTD
jgi:hypothetical protein